MFKRLVILWTLLFVVSCGGGGGGAPGPIQPPVGGPTPAELLAQDLAGLPLGDFYETSYGALLSRSPESVIWLALTGVYPLDGVRLDDLSDGYRRDTYEMYDDRIKDVEFDE